ncbi:MmyB family transcriptional regulator [Streptomyces decoyicus]|uniref:MmyB family transcriptional regulator n=1 Tax=Streptomyces decoyicus TaxID=249567 RepID=UPI00380FB255
MRRSGGSNQDLCCLGAAGPGRAPCPPGYRTSAHIAERASSARRQLMDGYANTPAFVMSRNPDLLAANALADALYAQFAPAGT